MMNPAVPAFQDTVWSYYDTDGRHDLPWRLPDADGSFDPYKVLVSEVMLQQTQVSRVILKYEAFLRLFPTVQTLATAPLGSVLVAWQGLGYNRRAKFLWEAAHTVVDIYGGVFPHTQQALDTLPGVGVNTAGALMAYAFNEPVVFIETNIRTVFIHHFFHDQTNISDKAIAAVVALALPAADEANRDRSSARLWYWALMDYGTYVKQSVGNLSRASKAYVRQSTFIGSVRQLRGSILRQLAIGSMTATQLQNVLDDDRLLVVLAALQAEGLVCAHADRYELP